MLMVDGCGQTLCNIFISFALAKPLLPKKDHKLNSRMVFSLSNHIIALTLRNHRMEKYSITEYHYIS